jgi:hypothetical protein
MSPGSHRPRPAGQGHPISAHVFPIRPPIGAPHHGPSRAPDNRGRQSLSARSKLSVAVGVAALRYACRSLRLAVTNLAAMHTETFLS